MKKFDFSKLRGSILLMLFMMCALIGFSQGTDDFSTLDLNTSYVNSNTTKGWSVINSAVGASTYTIGTCGRTHVVLDGIDSVGVDKKGIITSPVLTDGCGTLSFAYGYVFGESKAILYKVEILNPLTNAILYDTTVTVNNPTKGQTYNFVADVNVAGDFILKIKNLQSTEWDKNGKHKNRLAVSCIEWTAYTEPIIPDEPVVIEPTWVSCDQVGIFNTQVTGLVPICSTVGDSTVYHFSYTDAFNGYPTQNPNTSLGADASKVYVDVKITRPNTDITGIKDEGVIINFSEAEGFVLGDPEFAYLDYFPVATVDGENTIGNTVPRNWTRTYEWCIGNEVVAIQKLNILVDAAPVPEPFVPETTWVSESQVNVFNTQVVGLVPTYSTVGDSTVYHFSYTDAFNGYPTQNPNTSLGADASKVYVDVKITRPNTDITGIKDEGVIINFSEAEGFVLGDPEFAYLDYFPVATVDGENTIGNTVPRNWTRTYEWCIGNEVVSVQKLNILVDAAPVPALDVDSIAELPYAYNFDEGTDPYFMIENDENVNKWVVGTAQGFDNNKLYISSNNGTTNKYDVTKASNVIAYRTVMVPAAGAILSFDYRVNGQANNDYLRVSLAKGGIATEIATLQGENEWNTFSYDISGEMAGEVRIQFNWVNNASAGEQFPAAIDNISVIETPCSQPTALTATVDSTTAVITWVAAEGQDAWNFEYKLADHSEWYSIAADDTTVTLNNLQGNSNYNMRVQAVCSENSSAWTNGTFAVACQTEEVVTVQEDVIIGTGTGTNTNIPFHYNWGFSYSQQIVDAENINSVDGNIYSVSFNLQSTTMPNNVGNIQIWMANTTKSEFSSTTDYVDPSELVLVYSGGSTHTFQTGWNTFTLNEPFAYTGQNLLIAYYEGKQGYGGAGSFYVHSTTEYKTLYQYNDTEENVNPQNPSSSSTASKYRIKYCNNLKLNMDVTTITCSDVVSCETPSNLEVPEAGITPNSAVLTWTAGAENQTTFLVEYKAEADAEYASAEVNDTTYTLEGLAQLTNYNVRVKAICDTNDWSEVISADFRTLGVCAPVSNLETSNESNTTTLTWTAGGDENAWLVQFKPASADEDAWISIPVEYITMTTFGGLQGNTDYVVRVKATCDPDDEENQSEWVNTTFHSGCAPTDVPFAENFMTTSMPACWDGKDFTFTYNDGAYTYTDGAWLISPAINIPAENTTYLTVKAKGYSGGNYTVLASYRGTRADRFEEIYNGTVTGQATEAIIPLADVYKGRTVNFKIVANGTNNMYFTAVKVNQCPFVPTNLTASNITGTTVDLAWEADEAATNFQVKAGEQTWNVEGANELTIEGLDYNTTYSFEVRANCGDDNYGIWSDAKTVTTKPACSQPTNLQYEALTSTSYYLTWTASEWTQGAGTQYVVGYKAAGEADYTELEPTDTTFTTLGSLQGNTAYTVAVRAICSEEYSSEWGQTKTFTTPCAALELPYVEDFENYTSGLPDCWTKQGSGTVEIQTSQVHNGSKSLKFSGSTSNVVVLPEFEESNFVVGFYTKPESSSDKCGEFDLGYVTANGTFTAVKTYAYNEIANYTYKEETVNLPANAKLAFRHRPTVTYYYWFVDDIKIKNISTCAEPNDVTVSRGIATITSGSFGTPVSYTLQIGEEEAIVNVASEGPTTVDLTEQFSLVLGEEYDMQVVTNCVEGTSEPLSVSFKYEVAYTIDEATSITTCGAILYDDGGANGNYADSKNYTVTIYPETSNSLIHLQGDYVTESINYDYIQIYDGTSTSATQLGKFGGTGSIDVTASNADGALTVYFRSDVSGNYSGFAFNITCEEKPTCDVPTINVEGATATITSGAFGIPVSYDLQIGEEIKSISASAEQTSVDLMELFSLDLNTEYYVSVRSVCSAEDVSDWSAPEKVTTPVCEGAVVVDLSSGTNTFKFLPTYTFYNYSYTQQIYLSSDINLPAGGQITTISFEVKSGAATRDIDVYMMNSTATSLESGTAWLDITTATQVYSGTISFASGWNEIQLTTPFDYNGTDNLILIVDDNTGGYVSSPQFGTHSTTGNLAKYVYNDGTNYNPYSISVSGTLTTNRNNIKFNACPAPTCFIPNNLTVSEINDNSAVLTWEVNSRNPETVSYVVEYKAAADEEWQIAPVSELTYALNGLTASTDYMVRVKTDCGNADESAYAEIEFSTLCPFGYYDENEQLVCPAANDFKVTAIKSTFVDACEVEGDLTIEVANMGYAETVSTYTAFYQINNETPVKEIVNLTTPLNFQETATYTFSQTPAFVSGENVITTWVVSGAYEEDVTSADEFKGSTLFSEDFENAESSEIIIIDNDGDGYNWELLNSDEYSHAGEYCAASASYVNYVGALYPDNWMVLPAVNIPAEGANLSWWVAALDPTYPAEHYEVYVATAGGEIVDFTSIYEETLASGEWEQRTLDLSAYAGQDIQLAFVHNESSDNYMMKIDDIAVKAGEDVPMVVSAPITVLEPAAVPYVENFNGELKGWNAIDANEDGITMNLNNNINYKFNDELDADDWMMSPCIQMPAGTYTIIYDIKANSSLTESFEVFYGNGAHIADMTNVLATHTFNNTTVETATTTITISEEEAGIYNFGFHASSMAGNLGFTIDNFKVYPVNDVIITYAENGTVTPHDTVPVNYGENLTLSIVPETSYHVGGIWVDEEQVVPEDGSGANFMLYTLENVTAPHTVFVDFKLEFHIFKSVENYRPDLYEEKGGKFVNTELAIDTTINSTPFTVNMVADPHYHLAGLTLSMANTGNEEDVTADVMDNNDGTYSYTIDTLIVANYYVNATFRRDTVDINYTVLTGKGYANDSELLDATDNTNNTYTTWVDYSIYNDVDTTVTFAAADNYHIVKVYVNGEDKGKIDNYRFENVTETQNVDIKYGYMINTVVSNYNTYDNIQEPQGTLDPDTQYIPEFDPMTVYGTVAENFHLYQLLVNGENRIDEVVFTDRHNYSFTMDSVDNNYTIEAVVKVDTFAINYIIVAGQGTADASELLVAPDTFATVLNYADNWMSTITPDLGFTIANVTLDGENLYTASNNQFNYITEDHTFMVTFAPETYTITTNAYGQGTVSDGVTITFDPENPFYYEFSADPAEGYYVSAVFINNEAQDLTDVEGEYTTTIENVADNYVINVHFSIYTYTMTAEAGEGGSITPDGIQTVNYGSEMQYDIVANTGWYISSIDVDGDVTEYTQDDDLTVWNVAFLAINDNHSVSATFEQYVYTITATASENGTVDGAEAITYNVTYGENRTVNFLPDANYHIADVIVDGVSVGAVDYYEFINVMEDHTVNVVFEATMYTLTATSNIAACTITPEVTTVQAGENVEYSLTVANGYHLVNVIANNEEVTVTNNAFTISDVQSDYTIYANFAQNNVTVTVNQPDHATITPGTMTYAYGATPTYIIVPEVGYDIVSVTAGNAVVNVTYNNGIGTFTLAPVLADITLTATTRIKKFEITVTQGANGTITPGTQTNVEYGTSKTFTITPNEFYVIADVIVDGSSRGSLSTYTFNNITANHTITAVFEANCQTPTNLTAMDIDTTSAVVSWVGTAPSYEVRYKTADNPLYTTQTVTTNSLELTDLVPNTLYSWGVRAVCGSNMYSEWAINAFTTKALPLGPVDGIANAELSSVKVYSHLNNVYIVNEEGVAISNVDIYDIYGKQVYTGKVLNSPEVISLNVANGNYVVRLATENGVGIYKVAIVK